jgi:hypothetical protein
MSAIGPEQTSLFAPHMSAFGGKADIIQGKADIKKCPLMTQSGHGTALDCAQNRAVRPRIGPWIVMSKL